MQINPHISFNGQCKEAFTFYAEALGGEILLMMTHGNSPLAGQTALDGQERILHAAIRLGEHELTGADVPPNQYKAPQGIAVLLDVTDAGEADRAFAALAEGGVVQMPVQETFWALRFGMVTDRFGTPWMLNCGKPE